MTESTHTPGFGAHDAHYERINSLIDQAQKLMDRLCAIGEEQRDAIRSGEVDRMVEMVATREPIVRTLVRVGEEIGAFLEDPGMVSRLSDTDRVNALGRIDSIRQVMESLRARDEQDQKLMEKTRDGLADQLATTGTNQSALRAYSGRSSTPNPILQDRQG